MFPHSLFPCFLKEETKVRQTLPMAPLPQVVPSAVCMVCDVCCRFPDADSPLRPYFTQTEIHKAIEAGIAASFFPSLSGGRIRLVPQGTGEGYQCPAFDAETSRCRIYPVRPLDCALYPFALMWNASHTSVVLGWDTTCPVEFPHMGGQAEAVLLSHERGSDPYAVSAHIRASVAEEANRVAEWLEADERVAVLVAHPLLIGASQEAVVILHELPRVTACLVAGLGSTSQRPLVLDLEAVPRLHPLGLTDTPRFIEAAALSDTPLAAYHPAYHYMWRGVLTYFWTEFEGCVCLFARSPDGVFMPLPPLGPPERVIGALRAGFACMRRLNGGGAVSRVEAVPETLGARCAGLGYRVAEKDPDYLYAVSDLVNLAGDGYKSQRASCNQFARRYPIDVRPYDDLYRDGCERVLTQWVRQKRGADMDDYAGALLADAVPAHREVWHQWKGLGLKGAVLLVEGTVCGYTFGYPRLPSVFCVLLEVANRDFPGAAQVLFREFCRMVAAEGYSLVNAMDDSGLSGVGDAKRHYHPVGTIPSYILTEKGI